MGIIGLLGQGRDDDADRVPPDIWSVLSDQGDESAAVHYWPSCVEIFAASRVYLIQASSEMSLPTTSGSSREPERAPPPPGVSGDSAKEPTKIVAQPVRTPRRLFNTLGLYRIWAHENSSPWPCFELGGRRLDRYRSLKSIIYLF
jgi:hypothetical protein